MTAVVKLLTNSFPHPDLQAFTPSDVTKHALVGDNIITQETSNQLRTGTLQLRDRRISVHNVQDIHSTTNQTLTTMALHCSMVLSGSSPLQTCFEAQLAPVETLTVTASGQSTYVLVHEPAMAR